MKKVMHFGAGNIGRGFFGHLYHESGYHIIFVDIVDEVIKIINEMAQYPIWIVGDKVEKIVIDNISGISLKDEKKIIDIGADLDLISFSVGANNVKGITPILAKIIEKKFSSENSGFLNIIIGENLKNASSIVGQWINQHLRENFSRIMKEKVGLVETVLSRMVPIVPDELKKQYPLLVLVEPYKTMPVAKNMFKGAPPNINGFLMVDDIKPYEAMKLYIHNFTHAAFAYAGHKKNYKYIWEAVKDKKIENLVRNAYLEIKGAIHKKYRIEDQEIEAYYGDLLERFSNKGLGDTIIRVAREPIRKLGPEERIIGAAKLCQEQGIIPEYVCFFAACCLHYDEPTDVESQKLKTLILTEGVDSALKNISGLDERNPIFIRIKENYINFWKKWEKVL